MGMVDGGRCHHIRIILRIVHASNPDILWHSTAGCGSLKCMENCNIEDREGPFQSWRGIVIGATQSPVYAEIARPHLLVLCDAVASILNDRRRVSLIIFHSVRD